MYFDYLCLQFFLQEPEKDGSENDLSMTNSDDEDNDQDYIPPPSHTKKNNKEGSSTILRLPAPIR